MVLYASATSRTDACEPGGTRAMIRATVVKVPHVHGKLLLSMRELMDVTSADGSCGWEKLWTAQYLCYVFAPSESLISSITIGLPHFFISIPHPPEAILSHLRSNHVVIYDTRTGFTVLFHR